MICKYRSSILVLIMVLLIFFTDIVDVLSKQNIKNTNDNQVILVFRYDDYSSKSATYLEQQIIDLFKEHHLALTIGVVPYVSAGPEIDRHPQEVLPLSPAKTEILREARRAGTVDVALHGYTHVNIRPQSWRKATEFAGLDYQSQYLKIREGKNFLEKALGASIDTFIPPWSTYDANTLLALEQLKFRGISANLSGYDNPSCPLKFLPCTSSLMELPDVLRYAQRHGKDPQIVCVLFHEYDFREINYEVRGETKQIRFQDFVEIIKFIASQKYIKVRTIDQLIRENVDLSVERYINNKYYLRLAHMKPAFWPPHYGIYAPSGVAHDFRMKNIFMNINVNRINNILMVASFYLIILLISIAISYCIGCLFYRFTSTLPILHSLNKYICILLLLFLLGYGIFIIRIHYSVLIPAVSLLGASIGLLISFPKKKTRNI
jgi:peptidoglycan/xylan/chitin deacetylase (PgdA/CDA1 family)